MDAASKGDVDWRRGRGEFIHYAGDDVLDVAKKAYLKFFPRTALAPGVSAWPASKATSWR